MRGYVVCVVAVALMVVVTALAGCHGMPQEQGEPDGEVGSLSVTVEWPAPEPAGVDRTQMVSIETRLVEVSLDTLAPNTTPQLTDRPVDTCHFRHVPVGHYIIQALGYEEQNAQGYPIGRVDFPVEILPGQMSDYQMVASAQLCHINLWPDGQLQLTAGESRHVVATARTIDNLPLFVDPVNPFEWVITEGPPGLTVDDAGKVTAPALVNLPTLGTLFTRHKRSGQTAELTIMVTPRIIAP